MVHRPLFWCGLAFLAGCGLPGDPPTGARWGAMGCVSLVGALLLILPQTRSRSTRTIASCLILLGYLAAGRVASATTASMPPDRIEALIARHPMQLGRGVQVEGRIVSCGLWRDGTRRVECRLDLASLRIGRMTHPATGRLRVILPAREQAPSASIPRRGDRASLFLTLKPPPFQRNPGAVNPARFLRARGIGATGWLKSWRLLRIDPVDARGRVRSLRRIDLLRETLLDRIEGAFDTDPRGRRAAGVCMALLLGDRSALDARDRELLAASGLIHLLAVSGFNVAVLAGAILLLPRVAGRGRRVAAGLAVLVILLYLLLNRHESSVVRAVVMAALVITGSIVWRKADPLNAAGAACLLILCGSPWHALDPGFQLTFLASLALITGRGRRPATIAGEAWRMSLAATLATLPVVAFHFNRITPAAVLANMLAGPMMAGAFLLTLALEASPWSGGVWDAAIARVLGGLVEGVIRIAMVVAETPGLAWRRPTPGLACVAAYYGALVAAPLLIRAGVRRTLALAPLVCAAALVVLPIDTRERPGGLRITVFDVGQGESILIETPRGDRLLIDAGGSLTGDFDTGERVVSRALWNLGIARIDRVVLSHPDRDHAGGIPACVRNFSPREIWIARDLTGRERDPAVEALLEEAFRARRVVRLLGRGDAIPLRGARAVVLHPHRAAPPVRNERSLVIRVSSRGRRILLMGDAGAATERGLPWSLMAADVLKVGHHGSGTGTGEAFLGRVGARVALISCGRSNRFGHPHEVVLRRLRVAGVRTCRTDRDGVLSVTLMPRATLLGSPCGALPRVRRVGGSEPDRTGDERDDEHQEAEDRHHPAPGGERAMLVEDRRMARREEHEEHGEEDPPRVEEEPEPDEPRERSSGDHAVEPRGDRVADVPPVELPDRQEVQGGRQTSHPSRQQRTRQQSAVPLGRSARPQAQQMPEQRDVDLGESVREEHDVRVTHAPGHDRHGDDEPRDRTGDADVEQRVAVGKRAADPDERPERPEQPEGCGGPRKEPGKRGVDAVDPAGDVVPHLVGAEDHDQADRVREARPQEGEIEDPPRGSWHSRLPHGREPGSVEEHGPEGQQEKQAVAHQRRARRTSGGDRAGVDSAGWTRRAGAVGFSIVGLHRHIGGRSEGWARTAGKGIDVRPLSSGS